MENYFVIDQSAKEKYPGFKAGVLVMEGIENVKSHPDIEKLKAQVVSDIREKYKGFTRDDLNKLPVIEAYNKYYKQFDKSYHVKAQVDSVINGKNLPGISALLDAMFMNELKHMLLTAGHDLDSLKLPVVMKVADGSEGYVAMNNSEKKVYQNDLYMKDSESIISSIQNGPDSRTKITPTTKNALFATYVPAEIGKEIVLSHLKDIQTAILIFSPNAKTPLLECFEA